MLTLQYMLITGNEVLTDKQRAWRDMVRISRSLRPPPLQTRPPNKLQARFIRRNAIKISLGACHT